MTLTPGTQIVYIPSHADGNLEHPDAEFGFVTSMRDTFAFCRYWSKHHPGLRTAANSEATPLANLREHKSRPQEEVDRAMSEIESWPTLTND